MNAFEWAGATVPTDPPSEFYCAIRDVWQGRFVKLAPLLVRKGVERNLAELFASAVGEIGDNCFTHNAPGWIDVSGCWYESEVLESAVRCLIADRGRGILASLKAVRPSLASHPDALLVALTERITGRAPEKRGNGLKYVIEVLKQIPNGSFLLQSGDAVFRSSLPLDDDLISSYITESPTALRGTYCEISFKI